MSTCSQIGDLLASKLKRTYGIKDYSNIFPGHGGVLDRFDSLFFASAVFLIFLLIEMSIFGVPIA
jgi:phosphatidate cytidylyltransferase